MSEELETNLALTRADLWDIAKYITEKQKLSPTVTEEELVATDWSEIEDMWFDILEEIIFPEDE